MFNFLDLFVQKNRVKFDTIENETKIDFEEKVKL